MGAIQILSASTNAFLRALVALITPQSYRYLRMAVSTPQPGNDGLVQWSDVHFFDTNGTRILPSSVARVGGNVPNSAEDVGNLIDGDTTTKLASNVFPVTAVFTFGSRVQPASYRWATANDVPSRDPYAWTIDGSNDNSTWTNLDTVTAQTASTAARFTYQPMRYVNFATVPVSIGTPTRGILHRFRATSITGLSDGAAISSWTSDVGSLAQVVQNTASAQPKYKASGVNSRPGVSFTNTNNVGFSLGSGAVVAAQPMSMAFIVNPTVVSNRQIVHMGDAEFFMGIGGSGYVAYAGTTTNQGSASTGPQAITSNFAGGNASIWVNGVVQGTGSAASGANGINNNYLNIGNHPGDSSRAFDGEIYEVMAFNKNLDAVDRAAIGTYTFNTYNIPTRDGFVADPASIQNMSFRMRASDSVVNVASGSTVTSALDISGKGYNLSAFANADAGPTWVANQIGGYPVLRFSGSNQALQSSAPADRIQTIVLVHKPGTGASTIRGASGDGGLQFRMAGTNQYNFVKQNTQDYGVSSRQYPQNVWRAVIASMDPAVAGFYRVDGRRDIGAYSGGALTSGRTTVLGMHGTNKTENYNGDIAEIIVYDRILTSAEEAMLDQYIQTRYGINTIDAPRVISERWPYLDTNTMPPRYLYDGSGSPGIQSNSLLLQTNASAYSSLGLILDGIHPGNGLYWDITANFVMSNQSNEMYTAIGITQDKMLYYSDNRYYLEVASNNGSPQMSLLTRINGTTANIGSANQSLSSLGITVTSPFNMRLQYDGVWLRARVWANGATEPSGWHVVGQPSAPIIGKPTFATSSGNDTTIRATRFYSFDATSVRPIDYATSGTFDTVLGDWVAVNSGTIARDTTRKYEGVASMKVTDGGSTAGNADAVTQVSTIPGRTYTISGWVYIPSGQSQNPQVNISASGILYGSTVAALDTWTQSTCTFVANNTTATINVGAPNAINNATNTFYYIDSVTVTEAGAPALSVIDNGDGTSTYTGPGVFDNGDGTFTISGANVGDNGDGTFGINY